MRLKLGKAVDLSGDFTTMESLDRRLHDTVIRQVDKFCRWSQIEVTLEMRSLNLEMKFITLT